LARQASEFETARPCASLGHFDTRNGECGLSSVVGPPNGWRSAASPRCEGSSVETSELCDAAKTFASGQSRERSPPRLATTLPSSAPTSNPATAGDHSHQARAAQTYASKRHDREPRPLPVASQRRCAATTSASTNTRANLGCLGN